MELSVEICKWLNDAPFAYSMTYDEGTIDTMEYALPVHEKFGFPGHVDVVAGQLGQKRNCLSSSLNDYVHMSAGQLKELLGRGWGVGNHSWSHYIHPCQPGLDLFREVVWSKYRLEDDIESPVRIFTIPNDTHNYPPVLELVKEHYLACAYIEGGPNRDGFNLYKIGNCMVASGEFRERPGWPQEYKTENITLDYIRGAWMYETSHLCLPDVPQDHKCVTPDYMTERFEKLNEISDGKLWAAKPDDVIDYELLRRNLTIDNVDATEHGIRFDVGGEWPVGAMNSILTLRVSGLVSSETPQVTNEFHTYEGGHAVHSGIGDIVQDGDDWLITMQLGPQRTVNIASA